MTTTTATAQEITMNYTASIYDPTRDELTDVDIRTLSADRLAKLRTEAGEAGDLDLVAAIDSLR